MSVACLPPTYDAAPPFLVHVVSVAFSRPNPEYQKERKPLTIPNHIARYTGT